MSLMASSPGHVLQNYANDLRWGYYTISQTNRTKAPLRGRQYATSRRHVRTGDDKPEHWLPCAAVNAAAAINQCLAARRKTDRSLLDDASQASIRSLHRLHIKSSDFYHCGKNVHHELNKKSCRIPSLHHIALGNSSKQTPVSLNPRIEVIATTVRRLSTDYDLHDR